MQKLHIKDFSCIKSASLEVNPLTLIIGPQASGKSVISKLLYFFTNIIVDYDRYVIDDLLTFEDFEKRISSIFQEWFPSSAWGPKRFTITFELSEFNVVLTRVAKSDKIKIKFCDDFVNFYKNSHSQYLDAFEKAKNKKGIKAEIYDYELVWRLRDNATVNLRKWLGRNYIENQLFVPAGRSFFTSVGKALVAFEHSGILDPVTLEFGRKFSAIRERQSRRLLASNQEPTSLSAALFSEILGGNIKTEGGKEYIETVDGRKIPFSALSSGQQELLPLAVAIRSMLPGAGQGAPVRRTIYIEEPEAHLFPRAQNRLVEILSSLVTRRKANNLIITTHSPYVLAKFNNLIKAGLITRGTKTELTKTVSEIIPDIFWLPPKSVNAYAIIDGNLKSIMDDSNLIGADYLDDVSGDIAREFSQLLCAEISL